MRARLAVLTLLGLLGACRASTRNTLEKPVTPPAPAPAAAAPAARREAAPAAPAPAAAGGTALADAAPQPKSDPPAPAGGKDWPMWGGTPARNMVNPNETGIPEKWNAATGENIKWVAELGSRSYGNTVVGSGRVFVGTN